MASHPTTKKSEGLKEYDEKVTELVKDKELKGLLEYLLKRLETFEEALMQTNSKLDTAISRTDVIEAVMHGEDAGFEKSLKNATAESAPRILNKSEEEIRGTLAGEELQSIV